MKVYISSSWKNRDQVRWLANELRSQGHDVFDFTDPTCRKSKELPPERVTWQFDPACEAYSHYINKREFREAVSENREWITWCDVVILLLPCGCDGHADWAYGMGLGKKSVIMGHPPKREQSPTHLWADEMFDENWGALYKWLEELDQT